MTDPSVLIHCIYLCRFHFIDNNHLAKLIEYTNTMK